MEKEENRLKKIVGAIAEIEEFDELSDTISPTLKQKENAVKLARLLFRICPYNYEVEEGHGHAIYIRYWKGAIQGFELEVGDDYDPEYEGCTIRYTEDGQTVEATFSNVALLPHGLFDYTIVIALTRDDIGQTVKMPIIQDKKW